jgi:hypothetical protein
MEGAKEDKASWVNFLRHLKERGLAARNLRIAVSSQTGQVNLASLKAQHVSVESGQPQPTDSNETRIIGDDPLMLGGMTHSLAGIACIFGDAPKPGGGQVVNPIYLWFAISLNRGFGFPISKAFLEEKGHCVRGGLTLKTGLHSVPFLFGSISTNRSDTGAWEKTLLQSNGIMRSRLYRFHVIGPKRLNVLAAEFFVMAFARLTDCHPAFIGIESRIVIASSFRRPQEQISATV